MLLETANNYCSCEMEIHLDATLVAAILDPWTCNFQARIIQRSFDVIGAFSPHSFPLFLVTFHSLFDALIRSFNRN